MNIIGLLGIIVALVLLIVLVVHVVVAGALAAIIVAVTNSLGATAGYSGIYLGGMGGFVTGNLPIYLRGGIPRYMAPGILLGSLATAALSMPGSPQIQDSGPIRYLETSSIAAPIPGFIGGAVVIVLNIAPGLA